MKKIILALAVAAAAAMTIVAIRLGGRGALRGVGPRQHHGHDRDVHGSPAAGQVGQFNNVWKHDFTVIVNADGTFSGTGDGDGQRRFGRLDRAGHRHVQC